MALFISEESLTPAALRSRYSAYPASKHPPSTVLTDAERALRTRGDSAWIEASAPILRAHCALIMGILQRLGRFNIAWPVTSKSA